MTITRMACLTEASFTGAAGGRRTIRPIVPSGLTADPGDNADRCHLGGRPLTGIVPRPRGRGLPSSSFRMAAEPVLLSRRATREFVGPTEVDATATLRS